MPSERTTACAALAQSSTDRSGKSRRYGLPVEGLVEAGPVEPLQLPSVFTQMTNQRLVSMDLPGPSIASHQPASGLSAWLAACALGDRPVTIRIALSALAPRVPQVS